MSSPWLMTSVFVLQILCASLITWFAAKHRTSWWLLAVTLFCFSTTIFFTLSCWGTSDITKLNHHIDQFDVHLSEERFWVMLAPLIKILPYRMAAIHGLVATAFAALAISLSRCWRVPAWGGWWALLLLTSPLLRGFLQNAHTRQAWALLLVVPLFLNVSGFLEIRIFPVIISTALALFSHLTAIPMLVLGLAPASWQRLDFFLKLPRVARIGALILLLASLAAFSQPIYIKLLGYVNGMNFFSSYSIHRSVLISEFLLLVAVLFTCKKKKISWPAFRQCYASRALLFYSLIFIVIQLGVRFEVYPQVAFRFADPIGLFLLLSAFHWFQIYSSKQMLIPLLAYSLLIWGKQLIDPNGLNCGLDDDFLCIPDRWPWQIVYY